MSQTTIHTIDLEFQGLKGAIAVYVIPHQAGIALVECGPGSTIQNLQTALEKLGYSFADITDVFLTHIHLDHAGGAGRLAREGARIHVHRVGSPHLLNPDKLLASAGRIYGDLMEPLWGEFLPVPKERLSVLHDEDQVEVEGLCFRALDTPGHANHHFAYIFEDVCFSGDIGGVRIGGLKHLRIPMPPPEFHLEKWRESVDRLKAEFERGSFKRIAPTHFGIYEDAAWHLNEISQGLEEVDAWMKDVMPSDPEIDQLRHKFSAWTEEVSMKKGLDPRLLNVQEAANPAFMSADGIQRYWRKFRQEDSL
jgi:glyoxylase-like metal-dependent hydrolase (beta-lactamase superfamily II)